MQRDAIIVTLPVRFFQEYGMKRFIRDMKSMNEIDGFEWYRTCGNLPKIQPLYCYLICLGKIKYKVEIARYEKNKTMTFDRPNGGSRTFENKNWMVFQGPAIEAPYDIPMKGFQGFRYTELLF